MSAAELSTRMAKIVAAAWCAAAATGCFYVEPINQRPSLDIRPASSDPVYRGEVITLEAIASDPERQPVELQWRVFACTDALSIEGCDPTPVHTGIRPEETFRVPTFRAGPDGDGPELGAPVESLRVVLKGIDARGAEARPDQELILPVLNHPPSLELRVGSTHGAVVSAPIDVYARYGDADDRPENVTLEWTAFSPSQVAAALTDVAVPPDPESDRLQQGKRFTPQVAGNWDIRVVAVDRLGTRTEQHLIVTVNPDAAPCLGVWAPAASAQPAPITEPTLFRVISVRDDLDAYPRASSAAFLGEPRFEWSMKIGAGPRVVQPGSIDGLALDPQAYPPGTVIELRVEIFDRQALPINCADGQPTCTVNAQPTCIQRQTWRVEAR